MNTYDLLLEKVKERGIVNIILNYKKYFDIADHIDRNKFILNDIKSIYYKEHHYTFYHHFSELHLPNSKKIYYIYKEHPYSDLELILINNDNKKLCIYRGYDKQQNIFRTIVRKINIDTDVIL